MLVPYADLHHIDSRLCEGQREDAGNITTLRGLQPDATDVEIEAAALQYVRKVSGVQSTSARTEEPFERAVALIAAATTDLLADLPPRKQPPKTLPPLRRVAAGFPPRA